MYVCMCLCVCITFVCMRMSCGYSCMYACVKYGAVLCCKWHHCVDNSLLLFLRRGGGEWGVAEEITGNENKKSLFNSISTIFHSL